MVSKVRLLVMLVIIASLGLMLAACAGSQLAPPPTPSTPTPAPPTPTPAPPAPTPIPPTPTPTIAVSVAEPATYPVTETTDAIYAMALQPDAPRPEWRLDVYAPEEPGPWPVLVFAHGVGSRKENYATYGRAIAERGAVVFAIDWPTRYPTYAIQEDGKGFRETLESLACAIRFARARAPDFGGDPGRMILAGYSLGGGAGIQLALFGDEGHRLWEEFAALRGGPPPQIDCAVSGVSAHVDAFVGVAGTYGAFVGTGGWYGREWLQAEDPELWEMFYSSLGQNPDLEVRLIHAEDDQEIPFENSAEFAALLAELEYDVVLIPFDSELHYVPLELTVETIMELARD